MSEIKSNFFGRRFDGILFLWRDTRTHYFLKLMVVLLGAMIIYLGGIVVLTSLFGDIPLIGTLSVGDLFFELAFFSEPIFLGLFLFSFVELLRFYLDPEKVPSSSQIAIKIVLLGVFLLIALYQLPSQNFYVYLYTYMYHGYFYYKLLLNERYMGVHLNQVKNE